MARELPAKPPKSFELRGDYCESVQLEKHLTQQLELVTCNQNGQRRRASSGKWIADRQMVCVDTPKGNTWLIHGHVSNGQLLLIPIEALYLVEHGNLIVTNEDHVISREEAYTIFLTAAAALDHVTLEHYQVYAHLMRTGLIVYVTRVFSHGPILEVYKHCKSFKKTQPGTPYAHVIIVRPSDPFPTNPPSLLGTKSLLLYAIVDTSGDITYYQIQSTGGAVIQVLSQP
ncbi:tRNA-splicing endonuclease subunit Sen54-like [Dysidea avara]|uniref:tRNA-splicing endonuclease subunit Sen54-like n=1 Tax=Dysidea avara TaxID=196820 RepID=UPI00331BF122